MIEFYGKPSVACVESRTIRIAKCNGKFFLIVTVILVVICLPITIATGVWYSSASAALIFAFLTIYEYTTPRRKILYIGFTTRLIVDDKTISTTAIGGKKPMKTVPLTKVKTVLDMGQWYDIIFKHGDITNSWTCEKSNLVKGTLEDFERLFEGKIV